MVREQYAEGRNGNDYKREDKSALEMCTSDDGFDCNICLDSVQEPVVTLCGHLYCWPCIYKWLHFETLSSGNEDLQMQQQCPVCKAEVSEETLVPIFGRGHTTKPSKSKAPNLGIIIPRRPFGLACGFDSTFTRGSPRPTHQNYQQGINYPDNPSRLSRRVTTANMYDPMIGMFGEMINGRVFGNSLTNVYNIPGSSSPRMRRHILQADKSLSRICFFLLCCVLLCFLSF